MVDGSAVSFTASLMELSMQLHGGNCVDSFKAVVLGLPQWWEDVLREIYWSWKGVGITLDSGLVLEGCEHLAWQASSPSQGWEDMSGDTQSWKGWGTLAWVDSAWVRTIAGVWLGSVSG